MRMLVVNKTLKTTYNLNSLPFSFGLSFSFFLQFHFKLPEVMTIYPVSLNVCVYQAEEVRYGNAHMPGVFNEVTGF